jgi:hypothetical protein
MHGLCHNAYKWNSLNQQLDSPRQTPVDPDADFSDADQDSIYSAEYLKPPLGKCTHWQEPKYVEFADVLVVIFAENT